MSMTGWILYAPGDGWVEDLVHSHEQPWEVERRLRAVSGRAAIPMLACYVETSDFGYALALLRGELAARYVVNAHSAEDFVEGVWALEQCVALHGRDWQRVGLEALLAGRHLFPEYSLFGGLGLALGMEAPDPRGLKAMLNAWDAEEAAWRPRRRRCPGR